MRGRRVTVLLTNTEEIRTVEWSHLDATKLVNLIVPKLGWDANYAELLFDRKKTWEILSQAEKKDGVLNWEQLDKLVALLLKNLKV